MDKIDIAVIVFAVIAFSAMFINGWNNAVEDERKTDLINSLKSQINNSQEKVMTLELDKKMLNSKIDGLNIQIGDMKTQIINNIPKEQTSYFNKTEADNMIENIIKNMYK